MILVFNWKKTRRLLLSALLFCVFAAIIVAVKDFENITAVSESSAVHSPDKILIIDPGHGGADGGAVSSDGITESSINLSMSQKLEEISALFGVKTLMTRNSEDLDYPESAGTIRDKKIWDQKRRVELINSIESPVLISIHQNTYPDPRPSGAQTLYGFGEYSEFLGSLTHANLVDKLDPENRRVPEPISEKIYLMRKINCPAILVECGFISNPHESALLCDDRYQSKFAAVLFASYIQFLNTSEEHL